jgi:hypothetical protein
MDISSVEATEAIDGLEGIERTTTNACVLHAPDAPTFIQRFFFMLQLLYAAKDTP